MGRIAFPPARRSAQRQETGCKEADPNIFVAHNCDAVADISCLLVVWQCIVECRRLELSQTRVRKQSTRAYLISPLPGEGKDKSSVYCHIGCTSRPVSEGQPLPRSLDRVKRLLYIHSMFASGRDELLRLLRPQARFLIYFDIFLGLVLMTILSLKQLQGLEIPATQFLDSLTYYLDPLLVQAITCVALLVVAWLVMRNVTSFSLLALWLVGGLLLATVLEQYILKAAFGYIREASNYTQPWLVRYVVSPARQLSVPSGFTLRQTYLLIFLFHFLRPSQAGISGYRGTGVFSLMTVASAYVVFNRLYRGDHYLLDVGIGILIGIVWYWMWTTFTVNLLSRDPKDDLSGDFFFPAFASMFVLLFFCRDSGLWLVFLGILTLGTVAPVLVAHMKFRRGST